ILKTFIGSPKFPQGIIEGRDGRLYGTTSYGGAYDSGTVFSLDKTGFNYITLYNFGSSDAQRPSAPLIQAADEAFYGAKLGNGGPGQGEIFKLQKDGSGFTSVHTFTPDTGDGSAM